MGKVDDIMYTEEELYAIYKGFAGSVTPYQERVMLAGFMGVPEKGKCESVMDTWQAFRRRYAQEANV